MTDYLADTHVVIWALDDSPKLAKRHRRILESDVTVLVSMATLWEMSIKASLRKLVIPEPIAENVLRAGFSLLPIEAAHIEAVRSLPMHHNDPFDRMLIAQARTEGMTLISSDRKFAAYNVKLA